MLIKYIYFMWWSVVLLCEERAAWPWVYISLVRTRHNIRWRPDCTYSNSTLHHIWCRSSINITWSDVWTQHFQLRLAYVTHNLHLYILSCRSLLCVITLRSSNKVKKNTSVNELLANIGVKGSDIGNEGEEFTYRFSKRSKGNTNARYDDFLWPWPIRMKG